MIVLIVRRLLTSIPLIVGVTMITFFLLRASAGSFVPGLELNPSLEPEDVARIRRSLGLDEPWPSQYFRWLAGLAQGDFGRSLIDGSSVLDHILDRLPNTLVLTVTAMIIGAALSIPLGIIGAVKRGTRIDTFLTVISVAGVSIPGFWLALMLILLFSVQFHDWGLPFLPSTGATSPLGGDLLDRLAHLVLPATVLAFGYIAIWSRFARSSMLDVLSQEYMRTARSKGLSEHLILWRHALRNALIPLITLLGLELPALLSGSAIVEIVFSWPGIGRLALESALRYDFTMVLGLTTFATILVMLGSLLADILYTTLDPRVTLN